VVREDAGGHAADEGIADVGLTDTLMHVNPPSDGVM
jgi:hypothetical protein